MPKETFLKLPEEKKNKIIKAAKKEFARVPFEQTSIKNIVEDADIARGSFYQYFESKEDLLVYLLKEKAEQVSNKVKEKIQETDGDLFETYIFLYDMAIENFMKKEDEDLYKQIFINIKSSDESIFDLMKNTKPKDVIKYCDLLNTKNLKIENQQDFMVICEMLNAITRKAIIKNFKRVFIFYSSSPFNFSALSAAIKLSIISSKSPFKKFSIWNILIPILWSVIRPCG